MAESEFERLAPRLALAHKQAELSTRATNSAYALCSAYRSGDLVEIFFAQLDLTVCVVKIKEIF